MTRFDEFAKVAARSPLSISAADILRFDAVAKAAARSPLSIHAADMLRFDAVAKAAARSPLSIHASDMLRFDAVAKAAARSPLSIHASDMLRFDAVAKAAARSPLSISAASLSHIDMIARSATATFSVTGISKAIASTNPSLKAWNNISSDDLWAGCKEAAKLVQPLEIDRHWAEKIYDRALSVDLPWVLRSRPTESFEGFARILRLEGAAQSVSFDASSDLYQAELGDETNADLASLPTTRDVIALSRGFSEELISFAAGSFEDVIAAGFRIRIGRSAPSHALDGRPVSFGTDTHRDLLMELKLRLRELVTCAFLTEYGEYWLDNAVSRKKSGAWKKRISEDESLGRPIFPVIHYADFWDLHDLIVDPKNWHLFEPKFKQIGDFSTSMARLKPIRHAMAHIRPLGQCDAVTVISEVARLMAAMDVSIIAD